MMDTPFLAMKFGKYDNLLSFQKGEMYMKNFGFFRGNEIAVEPGQKDWYDAKFLSQEWPVTAYDENNNPMFTATASLTIDDKMNEHTPVFCMFMLNHNNIVDSSNEQCTMEFTPEQKNEMKSQFGDYVLLLSDFAEFHRRVEIAFNNVGMDLVIGAVSYYNPQDANSLYEYFKGLSVNKDSEIFWKRSSYSYQQEIRIISHKHIDDFITVNIGPIHDISKLMLTEDLINVRAEFKKRNTDKKHSTK